MGTINRYSMVVAILSLVGFLLLQSCRKNESIYFSLDDTDTVSISGAYYSDLELYPKLNNQAITWDYGYGGKTITPNSPFTYYGLVDNKEGLKEFTFTLHELKTGKEIFRIPAKKDKDGIFKANFAHFNGKTYYNSKDFKYIDVAARLDNLTDKELLVKTNMPDMNAEWIPKDADEKFIVDPFQEWVMFGTHSQYYGKEDFGKVYTFTITDKNSGRIIHTYKYTINQDSRKIISMLLLPDPTGEAYMMQPQANYKPAPDKNQVGIYLINLTDPSNTTTYDIAIKESEKLILAFKNLTPGQWEIRDVGQLSERTYTLYVQNAGKGEPYAGMQEWEASMNLGGMSFFEFPSDKGSIRWFITVLKDGMMQTYEL